MFYICCNTLEPNKTLLHALVFWNFCYAGSSSSSSRAEQSRSNKKKKMQIFAARVVNPLQSTQWPLDGHRWNLHRWHFMQIYSKLVCFWDTFYSHPPSPHCCCYSETSANKPLSPPSLSAALPLTAQLAALALITQILSQEQHKNSHICKYNKIHYDELH